MQSKSLHAKRRDCLNALERISEDIQQDKGIQKLGENVLLLSLYDNLRAFGEIVHHLDGVDYKYSIFSEEIEWYKASNPDQTS